MDRNALDARYRVILVIWAGLLMGVTLFTAFVWVLTSGLAGVPLAPTMEPGVVRNLLSAPVLLMAVGIFYRRGSLDPSGDAEVYLQHYQRRVIVASAMQEGGGLLGLGLCFLAGMPTWALGVWVLAAMAMIMSRPQRSDLDRLGD